MTPTERPSLKKGLLDKYASEHTGGAFNSKGPTPDIFGAQEKKWTRKGFVRGGKEGLGLKGKNTYEDSMYLQGFSNKKYMASGKPK